jgi:diadenosine tetraphosphate (Ap4A) HIT family hydrolase
MSTCDPHCPLCQNDEAPLLWRGSHWRVIEVDDGDYPGYTRVIWNHHHTEMTHLSYPERELLMRAVYVVEETQRQVLKPDKVNLASLGNMVPHLHWHVIPRWRGDRHFPNAVWATPRIESELECAKDMARRKHLQQLLPRYRDRLIEAMNTLLRH